MTFIDETEPRDRRRVTSRVQQSAVCPLAFIFRQNKKAGMKPAFQLKNLMSVMDAYVEEEY